MSKALKRRIPEFSPHVELLPFELLRGENIYYKASKNLLTAVKIKYIFIYLHNVIKIIN